MSLSELPTPVAQFLDALAAGDWAKAAAQCEPGGRVILRPGRGSSRISSWTAGLVSDGPLLQRPLFVSGQADAVVVVTLIPQCFGALIFEAPQEYEWSFLLSADLIHSLKISPRPIPELLGAVGEFIRAVNLLDLGALMATFIPAAHVVFFEHEYSGPDEIRSWADLRVIGTRLTICVQRVRNQRPRGAHLRCICDGDFDRQGLVDPVVADFDFQLQDARIAELIIQSVSDGRQGPAGTAAVD